MPTRLPRLLLVPLVALAACAAPRPVAAPPRPRPVAVEAPLASTFAANRGRLPWPARGVVTGLFGPRVEAEYGTRTFAPGMDLATVPGAEVRAVFSGTVERVGVIAAYGTYVMVSHGGFTTVYGNLSETAVESGAVVATGQPLGRAGTAEERRGAALFFAVFEGATAVDPLGWLAPR